MDFFASAPSTPQPLKYVANNTINRSKKNNCVKQSKVITVYVPVYKKLTLLISPHRLKKNH
jgi:hypothetical protein